MSKFCFNCGNQLGENDQFCQKCGAKQNTAPNAAPAATPAAPAKKLPFNLTKNSLIGIGAVVALLVVVIIIISSLTASSYKDAIDLMVDVSLNGKIEKLEKLAPKEFWEYYEEESDITVKEMIEEYKDENVYESMMEELEKDYGKNIKVSYKIKEKEKLEKDELDEIKDGLKENYGIAKKSVKTGYEVEVELTIKGKDDKDSQTNTINVVKIGKGWYIVSSSGSINPFF